MPLQVWLHTISQIQGELKLPSDLSPGKIRSILESLSIPLSCEECKRCITERVQEIAMKWSITPVGIKTSRTH